MKALFPSRHAALILAGSIAALVSSSTTEAASGTWTNTTSGLLWSTVGNWSGGIVADGSGFTADFSTLDITADNTVHLDSARTIGNLIFGDTATGTAAGWTLDNNGVAGNILTLAVGSGAPTITVGTLGTGKVVTISAVVAGTQGLTKAGAGQLTLTGADTYSGTTTVSTGMLSLSGAGTILNATGGISIAQGATFNLANTSALNNTDRVANATAVTMSGGTFSFTNDAAASTTYTETVGQLFSSAGFNTVTTTTGNATAGVSTLTFASLNRTTGSTVNFSNAASLATARNKVLFTSNPTLDAGGLIGGWATIGNTNNSTANDFATYGANGVAVATYTAHTEPNFVAGDNVNSSITTNGTFLTGNRVINAWKISNSGSPTLSLGGFTLRIESGGLLYMQTANSTFTLNNGTITAGYGTNTAGELSLMIANAPNTRAPTINAAIVDNGSGAVSLTIDARSTSWNLGGANTYSGATTVASGTAAQTAAGGISPNTSGVNLLAGTILNTGGFAVTAPVFSGAGTFINNGGGGSVTVLTVGGGNASGTFTGNFSTAGVTRYIQLVKNGTGTQILGGTAGLGSTVAATQNGFTINGGVLEIQNAGALGSVASAPILINSGGTLQLDGGITLTTTSALTINDGGTLKSNGSSTQNKVTVGAASTTGTLSTVNSGDVFTIGNASNTLTGGQASTVLHVAGPGTVLLNNASNYAGTWSPDAGTTKLGNATALGSATTAAVAFGASSTGKLQLNSNSATVIGLTTNATVGTPSVENGGATDATLTLNNAGANTYAGVLQNGGGAGKLLLTKGGAGVLTLSGNSNTYSGATTISGGTLKVTNASGSATGTSAVSLGNATLTGAGIISGTVSTGATSIVTPGTVTTGSAGSGVLTLGNLSLTAGTTFNYGLDAGNATANYLSTGLLTLPNAGTVVLNLYTPGTNSPFATAGTYDLFQYSTLAGGAVTSAFSIATNISGYTPSFGTAGGYVQLTLTAAGVIGSWTNGNANGNWSESGNWSGGVPSSAGDSATFASAPGTVTLDANKTVSGITFNNASAYTIVGGNTLTLDNNGSAATIGVSNGSHDVQTAVALNDNLTVTPVTGTQLTLSGNISQASGTRSLTKSGAGTLVLSGANTYSGASNVSDGILQFNGLGALGSSNTLNLGGASTNGTLKYASGNTADISSLTVTLNAGGGTVDTNGNDVALANPIGNSGAGGLTKTGSGKLTVAAGNTYTGATTIKAGTLNIAADTSFGAVPGTPVTNVTFDPGAGNSATLQAGAATVALNVNRSILINGGTGVFDTNGNALTVNGAISGGGILQKTGAGTLTLNGANTYASTTITGGTLAMGTTATLAGGITMGNGTTLQMSTPGLGNNITLSGLNTNATITTTTNSNGESGTITGSSDQTFSIAAIPAGNGQVSFGGTGKQFQSFLGIVDVLSGATLRFSATALNNGGDNTTFNVSGALTTRNNGAVALGALSGNGFVGMGTSGGANATATFTIGAKGIDTLFSGTINNGDTATGKILNLVKTGAGKQTLTGNNPYTGTTTVSQGTLQIGDGSAVGAAIATTSSLTVAAAGTLAVNLATGETFTNAVTDNGAMNTIASGTNTLSGAISGPGSLNQRGTGTTILTNASNSYGGGTNIVSGTLRAGVANALPVTTSVTFGSATTNGTLDLGGVNVTVGGLGVASGATAASQVIGNSGAAPGTLTHGSGTSSFGGTIQDVLGGGTSTTGLTVGGGTLSLNGANTYTGTTTVSAGTLQLNRGTADNAAIPTDNNTATTADIVINGGSLVLAASEQIGNTGSISMSSGSLGFSGTSRTETIDKLTVSGGTFSTGANQLLVGGATVTWSGGTNTISTGGLVSDKHWVITGGTNTVQQNAILRVQSGSGTTGLHFGGTASPTITVDKDATNPGVILLKQDVFVDASLTAGTAQILNGAGSGLSGQIDLNGVTRTFDIGDNNGATTDLLVSTEIANGALTKTGAGTLALAGANTYTGQTTVSAGTLKVDNDSTTTFGKITGTVTADSILVNSGGTLLLSGAGDHIGDSAALTLAGGTFDTGGVSETLGTLTLSADSTIDFGGGASTLTFADSSGIGWGGFRLSIWNWSGNTLTGGGTDQLRFVSNGLTPVQLGEIDFYSDNGVNKLSITPGFYENGFVGSFGEVVPVPEPSSVATVLGLLGLVGWRERRKTRLARQDERRTGLARA